MNNVKITVEVDIFELCDLIMKGLKDVKDKESAKAYMDCHEKVQSYLLSKYKEQQGVDLEDMTRLFENCEGDLSVGKYLSTVDVSNMFKNCSELEG